MQGGGQNGVAQEEAINEPVGNSEQLSSSESPNYQSVAEGDAPGQSGVYSLSELTDNEGNRFYQKNGSIDLWDLSPLFEQARRQNAPIRLTERNIDHILDEHKKELGDSEESVLKFLDDVFSTAKVLRKARSGGIFVVVENAKTVITIQSIAGSLQAKRLRRLRAPFTAQKSFKRKDKHMLVFSFKTRYCRSSTSNVKHLTLITVSGSCGTLQQLQCPCGICRG